MAKFTTETMKAINNGMTFKASLDKFKIFTYLNMFCDNY